MKTPEDRARDIMCRFDAWLEDKKDELPEYGFEAEEWLVREIAAAIATATQEQHADAT